MASQKFFAGSGWADGSSLLPDDAQADRSRTEVAARAKTLFTGSV